MVLNRDQLKGLPPIPQGEFEFVVTNCQKKPSSTGNNSVEAMLAVPENTEQDELIDFVGRDVKVSMSLQSQAAFTFGNFLAAVNGYADVEAYLDGEDIEEFDSSGWNAGDVIGNRLIGVVTQQPYQGRITAQIRTFKPLPAQD